MYKYLFWALVFISVQEVFPQAEKSIYDVYDFGAKGDGKTNDQKAIQKAIDTCGKTGGTVLLKNGIFLKSFS